MEFLPLKRVSPTLLASCPKRAKWYTVQVEDSPEKEVVEDKPVVELKHFSVAPYLSFDKVIIGTTKTCSLIVRNPLPELQCVKIDKFPHNKGFDVAALKFTVGANEEIHFDVTWTPTEVLLCREVVQFRTNKGCRVQVFLMGSSCKPINKKKKPAARKVLSPRNLNVANVASPVRRQTIIIPKKLSDPVLKNKIKSTAMGIKYKNDENVLLPVKSVNSTKSLIQNSSNEPEVPLHLDEAVDLRRATFAKNVNANLINDSLKPIAENSLFEDSIFEKDEIVARRTTRIISKPVCAKKGSSSKRSSDDPFDDSLELTSNSPLEDSPVSICETDRRATHIIPKTIPNYQEVWSNVTVRSSLDSAFFLVNSESFRKLDGIIETEYDESIFNVPEIFSASKESHLPCIKVSPCSDSVSELGAVANRKGLNLNADMAESSSNVIVHLRDLRTSLFSSQVDVNRLSSETIVLSSSEHPKEVLPFPSQVDVNRLSNETVVLSMSVLPEDKLPHHAYTPNDEFEPKFPDFSSISSMSLRNEALTVVNPNENRTNASALAYSVGEVSHFGDQSSISALDDIRRCSTGIKQKPPDLHFTSSLYQNSLASGQFPKSVKRGSTFTKNLGKNNLALKSRSEKPKSFGGTKMHTPSSLSNKNLKSLGYGASLKGKKELKSPITFQIEPNTDNVETKQMPKGSKSRTNRNETLVSSRKSVSSVARSRKPPKFAQRKLTLFSSPKNDVPRHPNPFASQNMYYDERWMEKQELAFTCWLNFVLTPPDYLKSGNEVVKVDAAKLWVESMKSAGPSRAPTKEDISIKSYTAIRKMNHLRRASCMLYQSRPIVEVIKEIEIETGRLAVRKDRAMHVDVGIKQKILSLLLCYNPLWLRIGLETVYGELLPLQSNSDIIGLSCFIFHRMLNNPDTAAKYAHPTVPHLYKPGFEEDLKKFTMKKFFLLVLFLDNAKTKHLIEHDPCLFCKNAEFKSSRDLLITFSREFLSGEGDITRHLRHLGYNVRHQQMPLEEFDFAVTNIAVDLRCGLRLVRVLELMLQVWTLSATVRVPAISKLQKIHNNDIALKAFMTSGCKIEGGISSRDIVDGHREKTLSLIWQIIFQTQLSKLLNKKKLEEEIKSLKNNLQLKADMAAFDAIRGRGDSQSNVYDPMDNNGLYLENETLGLLLEWCQVVCAHYGVKVSNFTVSFSDGRALCYLLHHYLPSVLPRERVKQKTTLSHFVEQQSQKGNLGDLDDSFDKVWTFSCNQGNEDTPVMDELLANEKVNLYLAFEKFKEIGDIPIVSNVDDISNTIPDEKVLITQISYLNSRLMDLTQEIRAARLIQIAWRKRHLNKEVKLLQKQIKASIIIQKAFRKFLHRKLLEKQRKAAVVIQSIFRMHQAKKEAAMLRHERWMKHLNAKATIIQAVYRGYSSRKLMKKKQEAAVCIQSFYRQWRIRSSYLLLKKYTVKIQQHYQANVKARLQREKFLKIKNSVILIQSSIRGCLVRRHKARQNKAATSIQAVYRGWKDEKSYIAKRKAAITIQQWFRSKLLMWTSRKQYQIMKSSAVRIQAIFRGFKSRKEYKVQLQSVVMVQACVRKFLAIKRYQKLRNSTMTVQAKWRAILLGRKERKLFVTKRQGLVKLQACYRGRKIRQEVQKWNNAAVKIQSVLKGWSARKHYTQLKQACVVIQTRYRSNVLAKNQAIRYRHMRHCTIKIQSYIRGLLARKSFRRMKAAVVIQTAFRGYCFRNKFIKMRSSAVKIQSWFRCISAQKKFQRKHQAAVIQQHLRAFVVGNKIRKQYQLVHRGTVAFQACTRGFFARKLYKKHTSARKIQSWYRGSVQRRKFLQIRHATCIIQKYTRSFIIGSTVHKQYMQFRLKVIKVQACVRGFLARKRCQKYLNAKKIQAWYRGCVQRKKFYAVKQKVVLIQAAFRGYRAKQQYQELKRNAVLIQRKWRVILEARKDQQRRHNAAAVIQRNVRCYLSRKRTTVNLKLTKAAVGLQTAFRGYLARKKLQALKERRQQIGDAHHSLAACIIQKWWRASFHRQRYPKLQQAALVIQSYFRSWLDRRRISQMKIAAVVIQASWRGYRVRSQLKNKKIIALRKRIREATANATVEMTLGQRIHTALEFLLKYKQLKHLDHALINLDATTRLSAICCERFVDAGGVDQVIKLVASCNRSLPHMELIKHSVNILLNVAKHQKTVNSLWISVGIIDIILDLMSIFREKGTTIFTKSCSLLYILIQDPIKAEAIKRNSSYCDKICSFHYLVTKTQKMQEQRIALKSRMAANQSMSFSSTSSSFFVPSRESILIGPDWMLGNHVMREFTDPVVAITTVLNMLCIRKKQLPGKS